MSENNYRVLARKYRPLTFSDLVGQDVLVRTLRNSFNSNRVAHAFILTGVRGVGKTTAARLIAKGLNCTASNGEGDITIEPCGLCDACISISESRHVDVLEMDAASRTGVSDVREIIENVHYRAATGRFKVYIIDEVHMLSNSAFNALLKTLEEPPEHVKFIFATTEINKVPVTVLSRCQRYDLSRIDTDLMVKRLGFICRKESIEISDSALIQINKAAEGSLRDALSILDQSISHTNGKITVDDVRAILGVADRSRVYILLEMILEGRPSEALDEILKQYNDGVEPLMLVNDFSEIINCISILKISPDHERGTIVSGEEKVKILEMATKLSIPLLMRFWQMLLKIHEEVSRASNAQNALEMGIIRMAHLSNFPDPKELIESLGKSTKVGVIEKSIAGPNHDVSDNYQVIKGMEINKPSQNKHRTDDELKPNCQQTNGFKSNTVIGNFPEFSDLLDLIRQKRDLNLLIEIESQLKLVSYKLGRIEFQLKENALSDLPTRLSDVLQKWTGFKWELLLKNDGGNETILEGKARKEEIEKKRVMSDITVKAVLKSFPGAKIAKSTFYSEEDKNIIPTENETI